jgi:hypothetical protein
MAGQGGADFPDFTAQGAHLSSKLCKHSVIGCSSGTRLSWIFLVSSLIMQLHAAEDAEGA